MSEFDEKEYEGKTWWTLARAARELGVARSTLYRRYITPKLIPTVTLWGGTWVDKAVVLKAAGIKNER